MSKYSGTRWILKIEILINEVRTTAGNKVVVKGTKNETSTRLVYIVDDTMTVIRKEKQRQEENRAYFGEAYQDLNYVIDWDDGSPYRPNYISELFTNFIKDNNLPKITLHGLRHSFASLTNASMHDASKMLGHSTPDTTGNMYTHMYDGKYVEQSDLVAAALRLTEPDESGEAGT